MATVNEDKSLTKLISDLARDTSTLVRKEVQLAKAEISEKVSQLRSGIVQVAVGGFVAFAGFLFLLLAATYALTAVVPDWAAALIVGGVVVVVGLIMVMQGSSNLKAENLTPTRTADSLRKDKDFAKEQMP